MSTSSTRRISKNVRKKPVGNQPIWPEHKIRRIDPVWLFGMVPRGFWQRLQNRRNYLLWLGRKLGFRHMVDWYRLTYQDIASHSGAALAGVRWRSSPVYAVKECFPGYDWEEWKFTQAPRTFWSIAKNRRRYVEWLGRQLCFRRLADWYRATTADFQQHRGGTLLLKYRSSVSAAVMACFPEYDWKEWMFSRLPMGFWNDRRNRRRYMRWLGKQLGYRSLNDWYRVKYSDFAEHYGKPLLRCYCNSPAAAVIALLPRSQWCEWMFTRVPPGFWNHIENRRRYVNWLGKHLGYRRTEDWAQTRKRDFYAHFGGALILRYHSIRELLEECFPKRDWQSYRPKTITLEQILGWADAYYAAHGQWPMATTVAPVADTDMTWRRIDSSLRHGSHGLSGGTSLSRILEKHRGKRVIKGPYHPPLSEQQIAAWQESHRKAVGKWPTELSGPVAEAPKETWSAISRALRYAGRGLSGGQNLAKLRGKYGLF